MAKEIERKFLVNGVEWKALARGTRYRQGYLNSVKERTVRVRTIADKGFLTVKGITTGATRSEFEYEIPRSRRRRHANGISAKSRSSRRNATRSRPVPMSGRSTSSSGKIEGLVVAEVELTSEEEAFKETRMDRRGMTGDPRYFNSNLMKHPFTKW